MIARLDAFLRASLGWLLALGLLLQLPADTSAQQPPQATVAPSPFGFEVFHALLESRGLQTTTDLAAVHDDPLDAVIVLLGDVTQNDLLVRARLQTFLQNGGQVLLATDRGAWVDELVVVRRGPVLVSDEYAYQSYNDCPRVNNIERGWNLTAGISELITNRPGVLASLLSDQGSWQVLARISEPLHLDQRHPALLAGFTSRGHRSGRMVALSDHSLLTNSMLFHGDNARLLMNLTNWLAYEPRRQLYFAVDGVPLTSSGQASAIPPVLPPLPPPEELPPIDINDLKDLPREMWLPFANQLLVSMEDADIHNELAAARPRELSDRLYRRLLYFLAGAAVLYLIVRQLLRRAERIEPPEPAQFRSRMATRVSQYRRSGYTQAALSHLAIDLLRPITTGGETLGWPQAVRKVHIQADWLTQLRLHRALRMLAAIAQHGEQAPPLPQRRFRWLARCIDQIQALQRQQRIYTS